MGVAVLVAAEPQQEDQCVPLLGSSHHQHPHSLHRTGTIWTAMAHIITGVIGAGVLSLAWSIAQLGWVGGPVALFLFAGVTLFTTILLCDCYRCPHPETGYLFNPSYILAVRHFLGEQKERICGVLVQESLYGCGIAYTITAAISMRTVYVQELFLI